MFNGKLQGPLMHAWWWS